MAILSRRVQGSKDQDMESLEPAIPPELLNPSGLRYGPTQGLGNPWEKWGLFGYGRISTPYSI